MKTKLFTLKKNETSFPALKISTSKDAADFIRQFYHDDIGIYESFYVLLLNRNNVTIGYAKISQGGIAGTIVDPKIVMKYIVDSMASGVILAHNHPSGNKEPSDTDIKVTRRISELCTILDSKVLDHVILTEDSYYSMMDNGKI